MSDKKYPSDLYLESVATNIDFAKQVSVEAMVVMARELLALRKAREGWKLVPVVLTGGMTNAMTEAILDDLHNVDVWKSILSAAPEPE